MNRNPSLERLISPDRADVLPSVSHPPKRQFVAGAAILVLLSCAWLVLGVIDTRISGRCLLLAPQGIDNVVSAVDGRASDLSLRPGDSVVAGQLLGTVLRPEFETRLRKAEARLADLSARSAAAAPMIARSRQLGRGNAGSEQATVTERLATLEQRLQLAGQRLQGQQKLFEQGMSTRQALLNAQDQVDKLQVEQAALHSRSRQLDFQQQEDQRMLNSESRQQSLQVAEAEREVKLLQSQREILMQIRAPHAGTVIEVKTRNGQALQPGAPIVAIERTGASGDGMPPLAALIFVRAADGKLLQSGMSAEITPTNVKRQEFGFIRASIADVSAFPASREAINQRLNNPDVVRELAGDGVATQVQATLVRRGDGNYAWSGAARQPPEVRSGSMCNAEIVVREQRPIALAWPLLKKMLGVH
ncbi:NHLP bacteriocin system secretion protein [Duganella sp. PWIR1]